MRPTRSLLRRGPLVLAIIGASCGDDPSRTMGGESEAGTAMDTAESESGSVVDGWPQAWFGDYHRDGDIRLGHPYPATVLFPPENIVLDEQRGSVEFYTCYGMGGDIVERTYRIEFNGDVARLLPETADDDLLWREGDGPLKEIVLRPGTTCETLEVVLDYGGPIAGDPANPSVMKLVLARGRVCVTDSCDEGDFMVDYCPGTARGCEPGSTESN